MTYVMYYFKKLYPNLVGSGDNFGKRLIKYQPSTMRSPEKHSPNFIVALKRFETSEFKTFHCWTWKLIFNVKHRNSKTAPTTFQKQQPLSTKCTYYTKHAYYVLLLNSLSQYYFFHSTDRLLGKHTHRPKSAQKCPVQWVLRVSFVAVNLERPQ